MKKLDRKSADSPVSAESGEFMDRRKFLRKSAEAATGVLVTGALLAAAKVDTVHAFDEGGEVGAQDGPLYGCGCAGDHDDQNYGGRPAISNLGLVMTAGATALGASWSLLKSKFKSGE